MPSTTQPGAAGISAHELRKTYARRGRQPVHALDGLTFEVPAGTILGLLGPNGAGKTTTTKILTTLSRADSGSASVAGVDVAKDPARVRRLIGYVAQKPVTDPMGTGRENVELAARLHGLSGPDARRRASDLLERFGLDDAGGRLVRTYSGGMARKLDVAVGIAHRPQVLFLDEPTTGLDPQARAEMWAELERMSAHEAMTVLLTTHYLDEADRLAGQVVIVDHGRLVAAGTPDELKDALQGDGLILQLASVPDPAVSARAVETLRRLPGLTEIGVDGATLRARTSSGGAALPPTLAALEAQGITVAAATLARPSLDDVYLRHTGHTLDAANQAASAGPTNPAEVTA